MSNGWGNIELTLHNDKCYTNQRCLYSDTGFERPKHISTENLYVMIKQLTNETEFER